jgi:hypothetical protein
MGALALAAAGSFTACQDHFDDPSVAIPVATMKPNTTIAEVKELMWKEDANYCDTVFTKDGTENGEHIIVAGRVISSDYAGNCFKYIILQDETGCLSFSINSYNLYLQYRRGQEVVVDLTGMHMGKYRGLEQVGFPSYNSSIPGYETSFMAPELFQRSSELNGLPEVTKIDTVTVQDFSSIGVTPAELRYWQSRIVRFNNVQFVPNTSPSTLSTYHSSGETQQIQDINGNTLDVRTSGYSNFWNTKLPADRGDVVAIMGYYINLAGTGGWQLTLIDANSLQNFGNPTVPAGSENNPYSVMQAIAAQVNDENVSGWTKGYIVGTVGPEVEEVTSSADIEWTATPTLGNTLVIGETPTTTDISECLVVALPQGSELRNYGALRENPDNYGKEISIYGTFAKVMGTYGITNNNGTSSEFKIDGVNIVTTTETLTLLDGESASGAENWTFSNVTLPSTISSVWSWKNYNTSYYLYANAYSSSGTADTEAWAISPEIDMTAAHRASVEFSHAAKFQTVLKTLCGFGVREVGSTEWTMLTIPTWPTEGSWTFESSGSIDLSAYAGKKIEVGFKYGASAAGADAWEVKNLIFTTDATISAGGATSNGGGTTEPSTPTDPGTGSGSITDGGAGAAEFNFGDPTTLTPAYSEADQVADGTTGNYKIEVNGVTFTAGSAGITNSSTGTAARLYHQSSGTWSYRWYKNSTTTIAVADGYHIEKIEFEPQTTTYTTALGNCTFSSGTYADKVWTPSGNVSSVTITPNATVGFTKITVTCSK